MKKQFDQRHEGVEMKREHNQIIFSLLKEWEYLYQDGEGLLRKGNNTG